MKTDTEMLDWLIKQGPPGAAEGVGLNENVWDECSYFVDPDNRLESTDCICIRKAINAQMQP